ncbi:hypothetical protein MBLNU459_g0932t2 [Dothideomycetes sp. NU459]
MRAASRIPITTSYRIHAWPGPAPLLQQPQQSTIQRKRKFESDPQTTATLQAPDYPAPSTSAAGSRRHQLASKQKLAHQSTLRTMASRDSIPTGPTRPRYNNDHNRDRDSNPRERRDPRDNRDNPRGGGGGGGGGGARRERSNSPHRGGGGNSSYRGGARRDDRQRSRSPVRRDRDLANRQRTPPRGPRPSSPSRFRGGGGGVPGAGAGAGAGAGRDTHASALPGRSSATTTTGPRPGAPSAPHLAAGAERRQDRDTDADIDADADADVDPEEAEMRRMMGFAGFKSTKNTKVPGNDKLFGVRRDKTTEYRQYMNRQGGFNRPLDAMG